ncbi:KTSC domain-containing protein [Flavobacterium sp. JP2137]|uniref:KTSC domain-containing protein n=1 Tax=Flavobacterium sp. JP2137 TaxID=3414510 RepID=UPI003D2FC245
MKRIISHRALLGVEKTTELKELKTIYRNFMKEFHPDKIQDNPEAQLEAEEKSKKIIEAYHFLVSIAPETIANALPEYTETITKASIQDFNYERSVLTIAFTDGSSYEYFSVPRNTYIKLVNADSPARFARRHIYSDFIYRKTANAE